MASDLHIDSLLPKFRICFRNIIFLRFPTAILGTPYTPVLYAKYSAGLWARRHPDSYPSMESLDRLRVRLDKTTDAAAGKHRAGVNRTEVSFATSTGTVQFGNVKRRWLALGH
jgi:hypothetical protein